ncbi:hypothetical protein EI983_11190 [Roseovarius faecimaris]|uniref:Uncharacterized protein n=1 Tax=Roseovarius faecimaris TaxID=2494550 RepID=A0A6I6IRS8_9RHOB|nr:hypothetical protein EI983_11190 [Roseovarius faecimaris]
MRRPRHNPGNHPQNGKLATPAIPGESYGDSNKIRAFDRKLFAAGGLSVVLTTQRPQHDGVHGGFR